MTFSAPVSTPANTRASDYPSGSILGVTSGANVINYTQDDLFAASPNALLATNIFTGPVTLDSRFIGLHCDPGEAAKVTVKTARAIDQTRWVGMNPSSGVFVDAGLRAWLTGMKAAGAETIYTIFGTPTWASARPAEADSQYGNLGSNAEPASMASLSAFVTWLMTNYGSLIDYIEVWNEPKYVVGNASYFSGTASKLAEMARTINLAAKAVKPSVKIMGVGAIGNISYTNDFLAASDNNGGFGKQWIDLLSIHTYTQDGTTALNSPILLMTLKTQLATVMAANGVSSMRVWSSEFGFLTPTLSIYTGPAAARIRTVMRYVMYHVAMGCDRCCLYRYGGPMGWQADTAADAEWNRWCALINGATVTRINRVGVDGNLACVINGQNVLV